MTVRGHGDQVAVLRARHFQNLLGRAARRMARRDVETLGAQLTPYLKVFIGYDFLFWSQVVRPGDQIDRNVNLTQALGGALAGPAAPLPQFSGTSFWAQGVSAGVELSY